jgi:serine protease Do
VAVAGLGLVAATAGGLGGYVASHAAQGGGSTPVEAVPTALVTSSSIDVKAVVAAAEPSVVAISSHIVQQRGPFQVQGEGAGTGVVIDADGHILTNAHVVEGASEVTVTVNGEERAATVVGTSTESDIAVLRLDDPSGITPATLSTSTSRAARPSPRASSRRSTARSRPRAAR